MKKRVSYIPKIAAVLAMLFILAAFAALASCTAAKPDVVDESGLIITEVVSSNSASFHAAKLGSPDWIELYNAGMSPIDLRGYTIEKNENDIYTFGEFVLQPGEYKVICACASSYESGVVCIGFRLSKAGESITIKDGEENEIARLTVGELSEDISYALYDGEYRYCTTPTPGFANTGAFYTELSQAEEAGPVRGIVLSEACGEWAEIYNGSEYALDLSMYYISDSPAETKRAQLPQYMLEPGEYYTIGFDGIGGDFNSSVSFGIASDEAVYLFSREEIVSSIDTAGLFPGMSTGSDANGRPVFYLDTTPGRENSSELFMSPNPTAMDESEPVHINELMLKNTMSLLDEDGDRSDWVELYNSSSSSVSLFGYYLSDDAGDPLKWALPETELGAGEYLIVYLSGKDREKHTNFKVGRGESLILTNMNSFSLETVFFPDESRLDNISYGIQDGKWLFFGKGTPGKANTASGSEDIANVEKIDREGLFITEVSATATARSGKRDWIELHNGGSSSIDLGGYYISNDEDNMKLHALSGSIPPGGYKLIYASSKSALQSEGTAAFGLSTAGESLFLTDENGAIIDSFETGYLRAGVTSGRVNGDYSGRRAFFAEPTPGEANGAEIGSYLSAPEFSVEAGWYQDSITVEISGEGDIYYTTDGSEPTRNSRLYTEPITISENTPLSAAAFSEGRLHSDWVTATYLFGEAHQLPVVCLSMAPSDFGSVYSVIDKSGPVIERKASVEYFEKDGRIGTSFYAGVRVAGNSTRSYAQKSLNLYLRGGYGQSSVVYPFFEDYPITEFKSLTLRNSGQDNDDERIADLYASTLMRGLDLDYAEGRFAVLYVNGRYYGLYDLKENQNEDWIAARYDVDPTMVYVIRRNRTVLNGSNTQIKRVYEIAQNRNMGNEENYEYFCKYVDPEAFIDYIIAQSFCGNGDMFNQKLWHMSDFSIGVRPVFYDLDFAFGGSNASVLSAFFTGDGVPSPDGTLTNMYIPTALRQNAGWREKFVKRCAYLINNYFDDAVQIFDEMVAEMETEMKRHIARWHTPSSYSAWRDKIGNMRTIISNRPKALARQMQSVFDVSNAKMAELFPQWY